MTYIDLDQQPDAAHIADWGKNIQSYITDEMIKHAKLHWEASYTPAEFGSSDYLLIRTFKLNNKANSMVKVLEAITKIKEVLVATNASIVRRVYVSPFTLKMERISHWFILLNHLCNLKRAMAYLNILLPVMKKSMVWVAGEETSQRYSKPIPTIDTMR